MRERERERREEGEGGLRKRWRWWKIKIGEGDLVADETSHSSPALTIHVRRVSKGHSPPT